MAAPLAFAAKTFSDFDDQMRAVKAVTDATAEAFAQLTEQAKELGRTTSFTAAQVAAAMLSLGRAGFIPAEIQAAVPGVLNLSRATGTELAESAEIAAGTLRAFRLEADEMGRVGDVLTATTNSSSQTLTDLAEAMKLAAPIAQRYGLSLEETAKAVGVLANLQIKGSMSGTAIRQILLQLSDPSIRSQLQGMGVSLDDFGDTLIGIGRVAQTMSGPEQLGFLRTFFGQRAAAAAASLATSDFPKLAEAIENARGRAAKTAEEMDAGLGGSFRRTMSAVEGVTIAIGNALAPTLTDVVKNVVRAAESLTAWIKANKEMVVTLAAVAAGAIALGVSFLGIGLTIQVVALAIGGFSMILGALVSPLGLIAAGAIAAGVAFVKFTDAGRTAKETLSAGFSGLAEQLKESIDAIGSALQSGDIEAAAEIAIAQVQVAWQTGINAILDAWDDMLAEIRASSVGPLLTAFERTWESTSKAMEATALLAMGGVSGLSFEDMMTGQFEQWDRRDKESENRAARRRSRLEALQKRLATLAAGESGMLGWDEEKGASQPRDPWSATTMGKGGSEVDAKKRPRGIALTATYHAAEATIAGYQPPGDRPEKRMADGIDEVAKNTLEMAMLLQTFTALMRVG